MVNEAQINALGRAGLEAMRRGDFAEARARFEAIVSAGGADADVWSMIAMCAKGLDDRPGLMAALDAGLKLDPSNLRALIMKGDALQQAGDVRGAASFYKRVDELTPSLDGLPPDAVREISRVKELRKKFTDELGAFLSARLEASGLSADGPAAGAAQARFVQSIDLLTGRKQRFFQNPRGYYFPDLPEIQFYDAGAFEWAEALEAKTDLIAQELEAAIGGQAAFQPYIHASDNEPVNPNHSMLNSDDWSALFLIKDGVVQPAAAQFPQTMAALETVELETIKGRGPMALFSKLTPGAHIQPHTGFFNTRLICHLPIVTPVGGAIRVGNETRVWERGRLLVFNDSFEHEAYNHGASDRYVLIFSIWRPELTDAERDSIEVLLTGVDAFKDGA